MGTGRYAVLGGFRGHDLELDREGRQRPEIAFSFTKPTTMKNIYGFQFRASEEAVTKVEGNLVPEQ